MTRSDAFRSLFVAIAVLAITAVILLTGWAVWKSHQEEVALAAAARAQEQAEVTTAGEVDDVDELLTTWRKEVLDKLETDPGFTALLDKHPLVLLHSRQHFCSGGNYRNSAYSFNCATSDERRHGNDVQLLFHNGGQPGTFEVNMLVSQQNLVADLGAVDFGDDPDPKDADGELWMVSGKAIPGHVYLLKVRDDRGNHFHVIFKVVAVDPGSNYMAFVWRMLSGGKVVTRASLAQENALVGEEQHDR